MKRIINTLEKMPKWYGFLTILLYSLLLAEFLITTNHLVNNNNLETDRLFVILARMSYISLVSYCNMAYLHFSLSPNSHTL